MIIGGRYGSPQSTEKSGKKKFYDRYESVTKMEFESALENEIPVYILIDKSVKAEYETFKNNMDNASIPLTIKGIDIPGLDLGFFSIEQQ